MRIVYAPGVWDLLHVGHVRFLQRAAALGDQLIVGVPADAIVEEDKGELPIIPLEQRVEMLQSLKCVTIVAPYYRLEFVSHLDMFRPNVMAVGDTWGRAHRHYGAEAWCNANSCRFMKLSYTQGVSTTAIKEKVKSCASLT